MFDPASRNLVKAKLTEWGPIDRDLFILEMTPLMPAGYAWRRYFVDTKLNRQLDPDDPMPEPTLEDFEKAQRYLVMWFLRQLRREGALVERDTRKGTLISLRKGKPHGRKRSS